MTLSSNAEGNYRFLPGIDPYSAGVIANPGFEVVHVTLLGLPAMHDGFAVIDRHLESAGRPAAALCAIELRSPAPFSFSEFARFNQNYREQLDQRGLLRGDVNPIARTNVAPRHRPPAQPALFAFTYTRPIADADASGPTFVVAGAGDVRRQELDSEEIVRRGETGDSAMREKATHVMGVMQERLDGLGLSWAQVSHVNVYAVNAFQAVARDAILEPMGDASNRGLQWHFCDPPIADLAFEMDLRGTRTELAI